ncbi:MAG: hypothetical protein K2X77_30730 [Candidatus Obscuribacterales bacterium]|nr:hypothetical protein [Candidatus Obscuribacterales bacterium]
MPPIPPAVKIAGQTLSTSTLGKLAKGAGRPNAQAGQIQHFPEGQVNEVM